MKGNLLEGEYADLRRQRVALRQTIKDLDWRRSMEPSQAHGVDGFTNQIAHAEMRLRSTQRRFEELSHMLGKPLPGTPVRLRPTSSCRVG